MTVLGIITLAIAAAFGVVGIAVVIRGAIRGGLSDGLPMRSIFAGVGIILVGGVLGLVGNSIDVGDSLPFFVPAVSPSLAGIVIMAAGTGAALVGIVALFRTARHVDELRRQRSTLVALAIMYAGFLVGYLGVSVDSGQTPSVAVMLFVVVSGGALALWGKNIQRATEARRRSEEEQR